VALAFAAGQLITLDRYNGVHLWPLESGGLAPSEHDQGFP
jgi:hypothetical protein